MPSEIHRNSQRGAGGGHQVGENWFHENWFLTRRGILEILLSTRLAWSRLSSSVGGLVGTSEPRRAPRWVLVYRTTLAGEELKGATCEPARPTRKAVLKRGGRRRAPAGGGHGMSKYLLVESRDPSETTDVGYFYDLATGLAGDGHTVTLFLVQNGVFPARRSAMSEPLGRAAQIGRASCRERV